jgi:hypothetical protein
MLRRYRLAPPPSLLVFLTLALIVVCGGLELGNPSAQPLLSRSRVREGSGPDTLPDRVQVLDAGGQRLRITPV